MFPVREGRRGRRFTLFTGFGMRLQNGMGVISRSFDRLVGMSYGDEGFGLGGRG